MGIPVEIEKRNVMLVWVEGTDDAREAEEIAEAWFDEYLWSDDYGCNNYDFKPLRSDLYPESFCDVTIGGNHGQMETF